MARREETMVALKLSILILGTGVFATAISIVAYDIYIATRRHWLVDQPYHLHRNSNTASARQSRALTIFGERARARAVSLDHRPKPLWVARFASQERRP
jgi:hypothetical protein